MTAGLRLALTEPPRHEWVWKHGAGGEEVVARALARHCAPQVRILHDRHVPRSRANIDHIAVAPSGVWVIDSKRYAGKVAVSKPLFGRPKLTIRGRDKSELAGGLAKQVALVSSAVAELDAGVAVRGALCFVDAELPLFGTLTFHSYPLLAPRRMAKRLSARGPLAGEQIDAIARELASRFRPA